MAIILPHLAFFLDHVIAVLASVWPSYGSPGEKRDAARATIEGFKPRDAIETMLAARMIATHHAGIESYLRAAQPGVSNTDFARLNAAAAVPGRSFNSALRTFEKRRAMPPSWQIQPNAAWNPNAT